MLQMKRFFPWLMALVACLSLWISNGLGVSGLSVFDEAILGGFGWNRGELKLTGLITLGVAGLSAPLSGILIDRYGVRICMVVGWAILAAAYFAYSNVSSLLDLYLIHVALGVVLTLCGLNAAVILVSQWFVKHRGIAIGIALVGTSLGGAIMPQYGTYLLTQMAWREAFQAEIIFPLVMLVLAFFVIRNKMGEASDQTSTDNAGLVACQTDMSYGDAVRTKTFWAFCIVAMTTFYTVLGAQAHLFLHMRDLGFTSARATDAISIFFGCALIGKFIFGLLADILDGKKVMLGNFIIMISGAICLASMQPKLIWFSVASFGFGWGGVYTLLQLNVINVFGLSSAGKILGSITVLDAIGGGLGIWLTGVVYEVYGSYDFAFMAFVVLIAIAILAMRYIKLVETKAPLENATTSKLQIN